MYNWRDCGKTTMASGSVPNSLRITDAQFTICLPLLASTRRYLQYVCVIGVTYMIKKSKTFLINQADFYLVTGQV